MNAELEILKRKHVALIRLEGAQDQTMRCGVINVLYDGQIGHRQHPSGVKVTERFRRAAIKQIENEIAALRRDQIDDE